MCYMSQNKMHSPTVFKLWQVLHLLSRKMYNIKIFCRCILIAIGAIVLANTCYDIYVRNHLKIGKKRKILAVILK